MNVKSVIRLLSFILLFIAIIMVVPLILAVVYNEDLAFSSFLKTIILMTATSLIGVFATSWGNREIKIGPKESYLFVTLAWVLFSLFGALPLFFSSILPSYAGCYFEIMSGFTTTGATALNNIEAVDKSLLFWRNMTNWLGGMGVVVLFVAILPAFGVKGTALVGAESVGPTKDKLTPHIRHTAMALWSIYFFLSVLETVLLMVFGLNLYNAVTVTFGTMGAAGFTPTNLSIASFNSPAIEWICIIFMFLSGANFALYFKMLKGQTKKALKDGDIVLFGEFPYDIDKKTVMMNKVSEVYPSIVWACNDKGDIRKENYDACDALVCALAYINVNRNGLAHPVIGNYEIGELENCEREIKYTTSIWGKNFEKRLILPE